MNVIFRKGVSQKVYKLSNIIDDFNGCTILEKKKLIDELHKLFLFRHHVNQDFFVWARLSAVEGSARFSFLKEVKEIWIMGMKTNVASMSAIIDIVGEFLAFVIQYGEQEMSNEKLSLENIIRIVNNALEDHTPKF